MALSASPEKAGIFTNPLQAQCSLKQVSLKLEKQFPRILDQLIAFIAPNSEITPAKTDEAASVQFVEKQK